ncbi:MAG: lysophospholipid acyltransferase family protein [Alphaproteobacteria bacterium]|nr:lysophospholipid acyltransferase family protein [Alphaproteobacteria bacterium]
MSKTISVKMKSELVSGWDTSLRGWARLFGFAGLVVVFVPVLLVLRGLKLSAADRVPKLFHGLCIALVGIKPRVRGKIPSVDAAQKTPMIVVCNHSSYLDIPVLGSIIDGCFVAKSEVGTWPFIGTMARFQNTVFLERKSTRAAAHRNILRENLEAGNNLIFFPEGTSSDGMRTLPFKSTLFSVVEKPLADGQYVKVQPVTILCTEIGGLPMGRSWRPYYAWYGDMTLAKHAWEVFKIGAFTVDVIFHDPVTIEDFGNRKMLADYCERAVSDGVNQCVTGRFKKEKSKKKLAG